MKAVYVIRQVGTTTCKIGRTVKGTPQDRLKACQTGNPNKLELVYFVETLDPCGWESYLHSRDYRLEGEWFELTEDNLALIQRLLEVPMRDWEMSYGFNKTRSTIPPHIRSTIERDGYLHLSKEDTQLFQYVTGKE